MTKEEHNKIIDFVNSEDYMLLNSYISKPYEETIIEQDKEIERLKEENKRFNSLIKKLDVVIEQADYKSRNERAIEYIRSEYTITDDDVYLALYSSDGTLDKLEKILQGEDKE